MRKTLGQEFLDLRADGASIGLSGELLGGYTHHLAHVLGRGGTDLGNDVAESSGEFFVGEGLGEVTLDGRHLSQFAFGQVGTILLSVELGSVATLLDEFGNDFEGGFVGELTIVAGSCFGFDEVFLDVAECLCAHFVFGFHGRHDVGTDLIEKHNWMCRDRGLDHHLQSRSLIGNAAEVADVIFCSFIDGEGIDRL